MHDTDSWPTFAEEIGRKTTEILEKRMKQYEEDKITLRELFLLVNDLYDATSGLAPRDVSDMLADIHRDLKVEHIRKAKAGA